MARFPREYIIQLFQQAHFFASKQPLKMFLFFLLSLLAAYEIFQYYFLQAEWLFLNLYQLILQMLIISSRVTINFPEQIHQIVRNNFLKPHRLFALLYS